MNSQSIGLFDSGIGGLTVMKEITRVLPNESITYFGDTARVPYGNKSPQTVLRYSIECANFLIQKDIKLLVIACNTACSSEAKKVLSEILSIPVVGVIEPGAKKAVETTLTGKIAVLGTKVTINSGAYQREIQRRLPKAEVLGIPCPLFVPLVEEQFSDHPAARLIVCDYLSPIKASKVDTVLLGCTHYPLLRSLIEEELGENIKIVDSALSCAEEVQQVLEQNQLMSLNVSSQYDYYVSDDPDRFRSLGECLLDIPLEKVNAIKEDFYCVKEAFISTYL